MRGVKKREEEQEAGGGSFLLREMLKEGGVNLLCLRPVTSLFRSTAPRNSQGVYRHSRKALSLVSAPLE